MAALFRTERHVNVDDVIVTGARAQQAYAARDIRRHDGDVDVSRLQQASQADLTGATPGLRNGPDRDTDGASAP